MKKRILAINPGSTSTKIGLFFDKEIVFEETIRHAGEVFEQFETVIDQYDFRKQLILKELEKRNLTIENLDAVVARGGLLKPLVGGTYEVNERMIEDLKVGILGEHASNLGGIIANELAAMVGIPAFIVDPVVVDEMEPIARFTGMVEINRRCIFHALNHKAVARRAAVELGKTYEESRLIVAHLGGGISVGAHENGRVVDVNNALAGDGPFSPERSGTIPSGQLAKMCFYGENNLDEITKKMVGKGGLIGYLGTSDGREVKKMILEGNKDAELVYKAMAYQISKEIGSCAAVLKGRVDGIVITGGLAYDDLLIDWIKEYTSFIGKMFVYPGEDEMKALAEGALRVLNKEETSKNYV